MPSLPQAALLQPDPSIRFSNDLLSSYSGRDDTQGWGRELSETQALRDWQSEGKGKTTYAKVKSDVDPMQQYKEMQATKDGVIYSLWRG